MYKIKAELFKKKPASMLRKTENNFHHEVFGRLTAIVNNNNESYFVSNEVSSILGYSENKHLLERLDDDEKLSLNYTDAKAVLNRHDIHSSGIQLLTESGLYSAILGSKKPESKSFKKWVTSEVLPEIRKNGSYTVHPQNTFKVPQTFKEALLLAVEQQEKIEEQQKLLLEQAPKVEFYDTVTGSDDAIDIGSASKVLKLKYGRTTLFAKLRELGILMDKNEPY